MPKMGGMYSIMKNILMFVVISFSTGFAVYYEYKMRYYIQKASYILHTIDDAE